MANDVVEYFPPPADTPTFVEDTEWAPIVDGEAYFGELDLLLDKADAGDAVLIAGYEVHPDLDLRDRLADDPDHRPLGRRLAELAARGVDVRVIIAGRVSPSSVPRSGLPFRDNAIHADELRGLRLDNGQPLRGRIAVDFSGALFGSNHQKAVAFLLAGELTAFVGGLDLSHDRFDAAPHERLTFRDRRWGWHDTAVRLRGPGAAVVWETFRQRWDEVLTLPDEHWLRTPLDRRSLNPRDLLAAPPPAPAAEPVPSPGTSVRVLRSTFGRKIDSHFPFMRHRWDHLPDTGLTEVFTTLVTAIGAARRYVYLEDQYLEESIGGDERFELYPYLRAAALRGVKVILVGSGLRDPDDIEPGPMRINRRLNDDLREKLVEALPYPVRSNVVVYRVEHCTVHSKLMLIDDAFANIGSANMFSRSMVGADSELTAAVQTTTGLVRDLRVQVWGEHLRAPLTAGLRTAMEDLDLALGIWRAGWLPPGAPRETWLRPGSPEGFEPAERVLALVGPF